MEDIFSLTLVSLCNAVQTFNMNSLSESEMILSGKPFLQYQWSKKMAERSGTVMSVLSLLVMVNMQLKLLSSGNSPMKSIATESPC